jgi:hypothetical protein
MPARLILYKDNQKLGMELKDGVYRVGRDKPADIVIADSTISGNHAEVQIKANSCLVRDLGSTNGTYLNGKQIKTATPVRETDELRFGAVVVKIQFPSEVKAISDQPAAPSGPTVKIDAVKAAASRVPWTAKYWLAGAYAILFLLILFLFILVYSENTASKVRLNSRYNAFASQYVHVLRDSPATVPPPVLDETLAEPIMVLDRDGKVLHPPTQPDTPAKPSPLIDPKTKAIYQNAKYGLFTVPGTADADGPEVRSFPVRIGGDLLGYVVARPSGDPDSPLTFVGPMLVLAAMISLLILYFTLRPVHSMVKAQVELLRNRLSPLVNGFVDSLPRSGIRELNDLTDEIEKSIAAVRMEAAGSSGRSKGKVEYLEFLPPLIDAAEVAWCIVSSDFKLLATNRALASISELARAGVNDSIFDTGMTAVQAKQLVGALGDARSGTGAAETKIQLTWNGDLTVTDVRVRAFQDPATRAQIYGIVFNRAA